MSQEDLHWQTLPEETTVSKPKSKPVIQYKKKPGSQKGKKGTGGRPPKKTGVYITVSGEYYSKISTSETIPQHYKVDIQLTDDPKYRLPNQRRLHQIAKNKIVPHYFQTHVLEYPTYRGVRTCQLDSVDIYTDGVEIRQSDQFKKGIKNMNRSELVQYCIVEDLDVDPKSYTTIGDARSAVADAAENKRIEQDFLKEQQRLAEEKQAAEFSDVNDILTFTGAG